MSQIATDKNFETDVLQASGLSLVDFWAEWCGPCKALAPTIDQIARERADSLRVFKLDVDANPDTAVRYGIRGIPALLLFKNGVVVDQLVGAHPKATIDQIITKHQGA
ncbi:MAG: thioredoxin [Bacteriovoracia bacterium]